MKDTAAKYAEFMKDVPVPIRAALEQLREQVNAQADLIALLLLELEQLPQFPPGHFQSSLQKWAHFYRDPVRYAEHASLAESVADILDGLRHEL